MVEAGTHTTTSVLGACTGVQPARVCNVVTSRPVSRNTLLTRKDSENSWTVERQVIEAANYDLKAVNPNGVEEGDTRTTQELLAIIEAKGREIREALSGLGDS